MLVRVGFGAALLLSVLVPQSVQAGCAEEVSKLMSKDTERLTTRYNKIAKQAQQHASPKLIQEECRIARQLKPRLENQLAALKQSGCIKDPEMGDMVADIVRGHEDDLAAANKAATRSECR
jgi:ribosome-binding ATPase YchF (GTP1/OBG family)